MMGAGLGAMSGSPDLLVRVGRDRWHDRVGGAAAGVSDHVSAGGWTVLLVRSDAANYAEIMVLRLRLAVLRR